MMIILNQKKKKFFFKKWRKYEKKFNNIPIKDEGRNTKYDIFIKYKGDLVDGEFNGNGEQYLIMGNVI